MPRSGARRWVTTVLVYLLALAVTTLTMAFAVLVLAGPHGGLLPRGLHGAFLAMAWVTVLVLPALAARWVCQRLR